MRPAISVTIWSPDRLFAEALRISLGLFEGLAPQLPEGGVVRVDVVLIDAAPDCEAALDLVTETWDQAEGSRILVFGLDREESAVDFIEAGASGYILKDVSLQDLVATIREIQDGGTICSPGTVTAVLDRITELHRSQEARGIPPSEPLTPRETEILFLLAAGCGNKEISRRVRAALPTVKNHVHNIFRKLGVHRRLEAVRRGAELGLLDFSKGSPAGSASGPPRPGEEG